ncbi:MAG: substrate-binding domain-containing protein [Alphaproteobacteria bacterium]|nr:substrate-binding domain-containing protein [Alphaproteobacteria bacterium]
MAGGVFSLSICFLRAAAVVLSAAVFALASSGTFAADPDWVKGRRFTVGFAQDNLANDWRAAQVRQLRDALAPYPFITLVHSDARGDATRQIQDIEDFVARKVNLLVTSPQDAVRSAPAITKAYRARIPVILVSRMATGAEYTTFIAPDNREIGRLAARYFAERSQNQTRIVVLQGIPTASTAIERTEGFREEALRHKHLGIATIAPGNYLRADALKAMEDIIAAKIPFDAIYAQSDSMAIGARLALKRADMDPAKIPIVGIDYIREAREAIRAGEQAASFVYPTGGKECADAILRILKGEAVPKAISIPSQLVTRQNVDAVQPIF